MKTIINRFHGTECKSKIAGCADLTEIDFYAQKENPDHAKYERAREAIIKKLCPHNGHNCTCWTMTEIAQ